MGSSTTRSREHGIRRWTPSAARWVLALLSGVMWSAVGIMLCSLAAGWLQAAAESMQITGVLGLVAAGLLLAGLIYRFGFSHIAAKNLRRIGSLHDGVCVFAFQEWKSYLIVVFMILLGRTLRLSPFPKPLLAVMYIGIGGGLFLSSLASYRSAAGLFRRRARG